MKVHRTIFAPPAVQMRLAPVTMTAIALFPIAAFGSSVDSET
jgi:hypothetical protein